MIIDNMKNCGLYTAVNPGFAKAFAFLEKAASEDLPVGRYEIDGDRVYAMVQQYESKPFDAGLFEGHEKYIDVQFIISGIECIAFMDIAKATVETPYDPAKDAAFFENNPLAGKAVFEAGEYGIFFPHDIHKPGRIYGDAPCAVKKVVVKVKV